MSSHKNLSKKYQKKTQHEHILDLPDTYIGSVQKSEGLFWIYNGEEMEKKNIEISHGLYKIFDEILVNACDHYTRLKYNSDKASDSLEKVTLIKVNINAEKNEISVYNNGEGIPIEKEEKENVYYPEFLFGMLLTSENYDKEEEKIVGGKNGFGSKLTNIYSTKFIIETVDRVTQKKYIQEFSNNMLTKTAPKIAKCTGKPYTKITFYPDLKRFNMETLDDPDILSLMYKRVYDLTICTDKTVSVYLNDKKLDIKTFEKYVDMYLDDPNLKKVYELVNDRWEILVTLSPDEEFEHVSFVNGIYTYKGGKHVEYISTQIAKKLQKYLQNRGKNKIDLKVEHIKKNMFLFLRCSIVNPSFDSQTKGCLTTPKKDFGSECKISDKFIEKLAKTGIVERSLELSKHKENLGLMKKETRNCKKLRIPKLDDAILAGTDRSSECTLILTEGDSAKALALDGLSVVGREKFGVFPLKGKLLNVREATANQIANNKEIENLKKILGLRQFPLDSEKDSNENNESNKTKYKKIYKDTSKLRYGHILAFTDQDLDGSHIKGLIINFVHSFRPELLKKPDDPKSSFVNSMVTPIVKVTKGKEVIEFYTPSEYKNWQKTVSDLNKWEVKYYKGLATSTKKDAKEYFKNFDNKKVGYYIEDDKCNDSIALGFSKARSDDRKEWLKNYDYNNIIEQSQKGINLTDFVNKDLIHFSQYSCIRAIPSICDSFKPSQRKILYAMFKKNLKREIKVSQFGGYVSEKTSYHHGENSLFETIIGMAQDFVGSNNINLLMPNGQFGTRLEGGKDAGSPRYIFTELNKITPIIYNKLDEPLYHYLDDDGYKIEPEFYLPILPMILVNGAEGIGTGYSTDIPPFNPIDIAENIRRLLNGEEFAEMIPWYRDFTGKISYNEELGCYVCRGVYKFVNETTMEITELPIGVWTTKYYEKLDDMIIDKSVTDNRKREKQCINSYQPGVTDDQTNKISIIIKMPKAILTKYKNNLEELEKDFGLIVNIRTSNMHLFNTKGIITKYNNVEEIFREYYQIRLEYYLKRKIYWLARLKKMIDILENKIRFLKYVREGKIDIRKDEETIITKLEEFKFTKFSRNDMSITYNSQKTENNDGNEDGDNDNNDNNDTNKGAAYELNYNYLLNMPIKRLTQKLLDNMQKDYENKIEEYKILEGKTDKDLWMEDLDKFLQVYGNIQDELKELDKMSKTDGNKKSKKKIKVV